MEMMGRTVRKWSDVDVDNLIAMALYGHGESMAEAQKELRRRLEEETEKAKKG
jgi:hypothetical protein